MIRTANPPSVKAGPPPKTYVRILPFERMSFASKNTKKLVKTTINIAKQFLIKKQIDQNGLKPENIIFTDKAVLNIIRNYTREAGVRNLEREISSVCRKVAREVVSQ